jgi:uncharacterized membrane protein
MDAAIGLLARLIEALGAPVVGWAMLRAVAAGGSLRFRNAGLRAMRRELAQGVVGALGLMTAATLLKTITLASWSAIGMFAAVLALRTLVKRALAAEVRSEQPAPSP